MAQTLGYFVTLRASEWKKMSVRDIQHDLKTEFPGCAIENIEYTGEVRKILEDIMMYISSSFMADDANSMRESIHENPFNCQHWHFNCVNPHQVYIWRYENSNYCCKKQTRLNVLTVTQ